MFFKVLAAMITADAIDRHRRRQERQASLVEDSRRETARAAAATAALWPDPNLEARPEPDSPARDT